MDTSKANLSSKLDTAKALEAELAEVQLQESRRSFLRIAIDAVTEPYHQQAAAKQNLEQAVQQIKGAGFSSFPASSSSPRSIEIARQAAEKIEIARQKELDAYNITSGAVKTLGAFARGKFGFFVAGATYALDEVSRHDSMFTDAALGLAKGLTLRGIIGKLGASNQASPALMSLELGISSRVVDPLLTRANYLNQDGQVTSESIGRGLLRTGTNAIDPIALASDLASAGLTHGLVKLAPQQLAGNTFKAMTTMSFTRGYADGLTTEAQSQYHKGELSLNRLAVYPIATALSTSLAAAPGNQRLYAHNYALENAAAIREREFKLVSIDPGDVKSITSSGGKVSTYSIKPMAEGFVAGETEKLSIVRAKAPTDWLSAAANVFHRSTPKTTEREIRFVSRAAGDEHAPWQMVIDKGANSLLQVMQKNSGYYHGKDVAPYLKNFKEPVRAFLGSGSESGAFMLSSGAVLKVSNSLTGRDFSDWGKLPHDAKALFGAVHINSQDRPRASSVIALSLQEPLRTPVTEKQAAALREQMMKDGVIFHDYNYRLMGDQVSWATDQVGIDARGKAVMLDYGARRSLK